MAGFKFIKLMPADDGKRTLLNISCCVDDVRLFSLTKKEKIYVALPSLTSNQRFLSVLDPLVQRMTATLCVQTSN